MDKFKTVLLCLLGFVLFGMFFETKYIVFVLMGIGCILLASKFMKNKKVTIYVLTTMYFIGLFYYLFYEPLFTRRGLFVFDGLVFFWEHIKSSVNLVPFKTIAYYVKMFFDLRASVDTDALFLNVFGNVLCLTPLAVLLPLCREKWKEFKNYVLILLGISFGVEILQLVTMNGAFDIDDVVLNSGGAILAFLLVQPDINNLIGNILFGEKNKIRVKQIVLRGLLLVAFASLIVFLFWYRDTKELLYSECISGYEVRLEMNEICKYEEKNFLYEDEFYKYYLKCGSPSESYVYLNEEKYSLEEYFSGKLDYIIYIDRLIYAGLDVIKEERLEKLVVCEKGALRGNLVISQRIPVNFYSDETLEKNGELCLQYFISPLEKGEMTLTLYFEKEKNSQVNRYFHIVVDENLKVRYEEVENGS